MKLKVKVKRINKNLPLSVIIDKGDWIDLRAAKTVTLKSPQAETLKKRVIDGKEEKYRNVTFDSELFGLGVAIQLPKGFEAVVLPRSGTFRKYGVILANNEGVIDQSYCGDGDEWKFNALAFRDTVINEGDRVGQFRIQLSQKATFWQKLKWLLSSGIEIVEVESLSKVNRGGFGSTGIK